MAYLNPQPSYTASRGGGGGVKPLDHITPTHLSIQHYICDTLRLGQSHGCVEIEFGRGPGGPLDRCGGVPLTGGKDQGAGVD